MHRFVHVFCILPTFVIYHSHYQGHLPTSERAKSQDSGDAQHMVGKTLRAANEFRTKPHSKAAQKGLSSENYVGLFSNIFKARQLLQKWVYPCISELSWHKHRHVKNFSASDSWDQRCLPQVRLRGSQDFPLAIDWILPNNSISLKTVHGKSINHNFLVGVTSRQHHPQTAPLHRCLTEGSQPALSFMLYVPTQLLVCLHLSAQCT